LRAKKAVHLAQEVNVRVLILDDHRMFAEAIRSVLEDRGVDVVGIAETPSDAIHMATAARPDVVVIDVGIRNGGGLRAGEEILHVDPRIRLIALSSPDDTDMARHALRLGFQGCLTKDADSLELVTAIHDVAGGEIVVQPQLARRTVKRWAHDRDAEVLVDQLTRREREVLRMIAAAISSEEIARRLSISVNTVRSHIQSIFTKLQVHSRLEAVAFAARNGLLQAPASEPSWLFLDGMPEAASEASEPSTA